MSEPIKWVNTGGAPIQGSDLGCVWAEVWICDCGAINEDVWAICCDCGEYKPRPCDSCGSGFVPWSESNKGNAKLHKYTCRRCHLASADLETTEP